MDSKFELLSNELDALIHAGELLYYSMGNAQGQLPEKLKKGLDKEGVVLPDFISKYDTWYSESMLVIKQIIPERYDDFVKQYKNEKRKGLDSLTYCISDYLLGIQSSRGQTVIVNQSAAIPKMQIQNSILASAKKKFKSSLFDIKELLQADIYDSELDAARDLSKKGFVRAGGAIAGVVLEKHLSHICNLHNLKSGKKHPSISDYYQILKDNDIIDIPKWRFIQHLGDLRNLCDHNKDREPTKEEVLELVEGVDKVIKTVY